MYTRRNAAQVLGLAVMSGLGLYHAKAGAGGAAPTPPADTVAGGEGEQAPEKLDITQDEYDRRMKEETDKAVKAAIEKREEEEKRNRRKRRGKEDEEDEEDLVDAANKAEAKAAEYQQRYEAAERKALLSEVNVKLRDYLTANARDYLGNAPDIMLHVEKTLETNASERQIAVAIESHTKAFVERSKSARGAGGGAPGSAVRGRMAGPANSGQQGNQTNQQQGERQTAAAPRFRTLNWHG